MIPCVCYSKQQLCIFHFRRCRSKTDHQFVSALFEFKLGKLIPGRTMECGNHCAYNLCVNFLYNCLTRPVPVLYYIDLTEKNNR